MDWKLPLLDLLRIVTATTLGACIGWEREIHGAQAGIRTFAFIAVGSCLFGIISHSILGADPARIAAQVVTGIGFLGGGIIFKEKGGIAGLTTAASLWATGAVGLSVAYDYYYLAILTTVIMFIALHAPQMSWWDRVSKKSRRRSRNH